MMHGRELARFAREKVREALGAGLVRPPEGDGFDAPGATFVTVKWPDGRLQGCIGSLEPRRAIVRDVAHNALAATFDDPRATPIALDDVDDLDFELSILSPLERVPWDTEADVARGIQVGKHGVLLVWKSHRATYLPAMWEHFRDVPELLASLKEKAGLAPTFWAPDVEIYRYTVEKHVDPGERSRPS